MALSFTGRQLLVTFKLPDEKRGVTLRVARYDIGTFVSILESNNAERIEIVPEKVA